MNGEEEEKRRGGIDEAREKGSRRRQISAVARKEGSKEDVKGERFIDSV